LTCEDIRTVAPMVLRHRLRRDPLDESGSDSRIARVLETMVVS
jgi:magnesium chelatase subunit I